MPTASFVKQELDELLSRQRHTQVVPYRDDLEGRTVTLEGGIPGLEPYPPVPRLGTRAHVPESRAYRAGSATPVASA